VWPHALKMVLPVCVYLSSQCPYLMMTEPHVSPAPKPAIATCVREEQGLA
jgi:hypothetical protein